MSATIVVVPSVLLLQKTWFIVDWETALRSWIARGGTEATYCALPWQERVARAEAACQVRRELGEPDPVDPPIRLPTLDPEQT